jgi:hypothetical protein
LADRGSSCGGAAASLYREDRGAGSSVASGSIVRGSAADRTSAVTTQNTDRTSDDSDAHGVATCRWYRGAARSSQKKHRSMWEQWRHGPKLPSWLSHSGRGARHWLSHKSERFHLAVFLLVNGAPLVSVHMFFRVSGLQRPQSSGPCARHYA